MVMDHDAIDTTSWSQRNGDRIGVTILADLFRWLNSHNLCGVFYLLFYLLMLRGITSFSVLFCVLNSLCCLNCDFLDYFGICLLVWCGLMGLFFVWLWGLMFEYVGILFLGYVLDWVIYIHSGNQKQQWEISVHKVLNGKDKKKLYKSADVHCHIWLPDGISFQIFILMDGLEDSDVWFRITQFFEHHDTIRAFFVIDTWSSI